MHKRATKQETELRVAHAAELVAEGQAYSSITSLIATSKIWHIKKKSEADHF